MSKGYDPHELERCRARYCQTRASVLILRTIADGTDTEEILIGYCAFHAVTANIFFGRNPLRSEVKGISPC